nr:type II toxin-antitoxin system YoeB family toxin [Shewanella baltica]
MCKPEGLKENLSGFWSRRIFDTNRFMMLMNMLISCRHHY